MFVVDFIGASVLAFVLTVGFAAVVRARGCRRWGELSARVWMISVGSWVAGMLLVAFGPAVTGGNHWLPFAVTGLLVGLLVLTLGKVPRFRRLVHAETGDPGNDARPAIALYFFVTLLLFFCAISFRFYIVNLT